MSQTRAFNRGIFYSISAPFVHMVGGKRRSFFAEFSVDHAIVANRLCFCAESRPRDGCRKMRVRKLRRLDYLLGLFSHSIAAVGAYLAIYIRFSAIRRSLFRIFLFFSPLRLFIVLFILARIMRHFARVKVARECEREVCFFGYDGFY